MNLIKYRTYFHYYCEYYVHSQGYTTTHRICKAVFYIKSCQYNTLIYNMDMLLNAVDAVCDVDVRLDYDAEYNISNLAMDTIFISREQFNVKCLLNE